MSVIFQVLATVVVSFICLSVGILYTWPSSTLVLFTSPNTTLNRVMTETEVSLLGSLSSISGIIVTPFAGYIMDSLGRKWACIVFNLAQIASWVIVCTCTMVEAILFAMFVFGLSSCMFIVVPIYVSEFCEDSIRGSMMSSSMVSYGLGMLVSYVMGGLLDYDTMNYVGLSVAVLGLVLFGTMKESPLHLLNIGREREARRSVAFYRNVKITSKVVDEEIEKIRRILNPEDDTDTKIEEKQELNVQEAATTKKSQWQCLKKSRIAQRGLVVSIALYTASIFQGLIVVQVYAGPLFTQALPTMSATVSSVLFALVTVIASLIAAYFMDMLGRRPLMIYGSIGTGLCSAIFGSQIHVNWGPNWLTAVFMFLYSLTYIIGAGTVPYVVVGEIFMPEVKSLASMIATEWALVCNFIVLFIFNPLVNSVGLGPVFYIFSICCFLSGLFCFYYLPETSGLAVDDIQERLKRPRNNKP
ncbi:facilitated trehalose transporter Tret1-like [Melitaea cinxia]|uniref:facilitated trehalose transporter Tret1-like n=1 Tax=Melitaea cinxia TaxID=113334 RepID=UPI001E2713F4|nr:facilitated trehalose transporter Tret1-like [Melitaea cinxia]